MLSTKVTDLQAFVGTLDPNDPLTTRTIIISSSYSTWHQRTLNSEEMAKATSKRADGDEDLSDDEDERELDSDTLRQLK